MHYEVVYFLLHMKCGKKKLRGLVLSDGDTFSGVVYEITIETWIDILS